MNNESLVTFGANLCAERHRKKLSQEDLAAKAGLQMQQISKIENGKADFKFTTLLRLMKTRDVKFELLFDIDAQ